MKNKSDVSMNSDKDNSYYYSFHNVMKKHNFFKKKEIQSIIPLIEDDEVLIVRLDGKGLTKQFCATKIYDETLFCSMKYVLTEIGEYIPIIFAYVANDEISIIIDKSYISTKSIGNRIEKLLTYVSGYVSSLFTIEMSKHIRLKQPFAFDARILILKRNLLNDYFVCRQKCSIWHFIEKVCNFHHIKKDGTIESIKNRINESRDNWDNYPKYVIYGYIGHKNESGKWDIIEAVDFMIEGKQYLKYIQ